MEMVGGGPAPTKLVVGWLDGREDGWMQTCGLPSSQEAVYRIQNAKYLLLCGQKTECTVVDDSGWVQQTGCSGRGRTNIR